MMMTRRHLLNELKKYRAELTAIRKALTTLDIPEKRKGEKTILAKIAWLETKIKGTEPTITVSDHALIRYIERVLKIDLEDLRNTIVTPEIYDLYCEYGDGTYKGIVIKDDVVVTVVTSER